MTILSDRQIIYRCKTDGMITPFEPKQVKELNGRRYISYGLSSYGYDIRLADDDLRIVVPGWEKLAGLGDEVVLDPKNAQPWLFTTVQPMEDKSGRYIIIPPNSFALGRSVEHFNISRDILVVAVGKSTYARTGVTILVTPFEPEWEGYATLEISNTTPYPVRVYVEEGIAQLIFHKADDTCKTSYRDRKGKYQDQLAQIVMATV